MVFQWFNSDGTSDINIEPFDKVVNAAIKTGLKLLVAMSNNWGDFGGMDVYTVNLGGKYHDDVSCWCFSFFFPRSAFTAVKWDPCSANSGVPHPPHPVLHGPPHQGCVQTICQGDGHSLQGLTGHHGLGADQ